MVQLPVAVRKVPPSRPALLPALGISHPRRRPTMLSKRARVCRGRPRRSARHCARSSEYAAPTSRKSSAPGPPTTGSGECPAYAPASPSAGEACATASSAACAGEACSCAIPQSADAPAESASAAPANWGGARHVRWVWSKRDGRGRRSRPGRRRVLSRRMHQGDVRTMPLDRSCQL